MIDLTTLAAAKAYTDRQRLAYDESVTIEWDGDSTGKVTDNDGVYVKVSDLTPEPSDLIGGTLVFTAGSDSQTNIITEEMIVDFRTTEGVPCAAVTEVIFIVYGAVSELSVTETGIYFIGGGNAYVSSLTYGSIKKIDKKYLPDDIGGGLPVVKITTPIDSSKFDDPGFIELNEEDCAALANIITNECPYIVVLNANLLGEYLKIRSVMSVAILGDVMFSNGSCMLDSIEMKIAISGDGENFDIQITKNQQS